MLPSFAGKRRGEIYHAPTLVDRFWLIQISFYIIYIYLSAGINYP